jgi:hypothetical protein
LNPQLYSLCAPNAWPQLQAEAVGLISYGIPNLQIDDVRRLNRLLIEAVFSLSKNFPISHPFAFETYADYWLNRLANATFANAVSARESQYVKATWWNNPGDAPHGFLADESAPLPEFWQDRLATTDGLERLTNSCFGNTDMTVHADRMSAGFHQLAPIIIQLGLMRRCEVLTVENPEVHLHPSLQLDIAAFLAAESRTGKFLIVETHSDLIVRRIIREMWKDETLRQEKVRIYFTEIKAGGPIGFDYSTLTPITVDDRGRIKNWPKGFMDDDVMESRKLLEIMYPPPGDDNRREE